MIAGLSCALVLAAGRGTRLRPLTCVRAKPAVPVAGRALVRRIIAWLAAEGVRDLVLNLHYLPDTITRLVGDGADLGVRVRYSWERRILGTAGGPRRALPLLEADRFLLVNGDTLTGVRLGAMAAAHRESGARVTMALIPNPAPDRYGGVLLDGEGWVTGFTPRGRAAASYHFIGPQIAEASVFAGLPDGEPAESVNVLYPALIAADRKAIRGFVSDASFHDIGTPADYLAASLALARADGRDAPPPGRGVRIHPDARVVRTVTWDEVTIEAGAELVDCVVADAVTVPAGARFERCAIVSARGCAPAPGEALVGDLLVAPFAPGGRPESSGPTPV